MNTHTSSFVDRVMYSHINDVGNIDFGALLQQVVINVSNLQYVPCDLSLSSYTMAAAVHWGGQSLIC